MDEAIVSGGVNAGGSGVDIISVNENGMSGGGNVAQRLLASGGNFNSLRTNGVLLRDEWKMFDNVVVDITRENLVAVAEVMNRGLVYNLPNAMGSLTLEWQELLDDLADAEISMSGLNEATKDRMSYGTRAMPIPLIHKEFFYNLRFLEAARRHGRQIETDHAAIATRKVAERIETMLFSGLTIAQSQGVIYGLLNHPDRNTGSGGNFASLTGEQIVTQVIAMLNVMNTKFMNGPFVLFIPLTASAHLGDDYKANSDRTIWERLMAIPQISKIVATPKLTTTNVVLVQMTSDVIQMVDGMQPMMIEWETRGGMEFNFKVVAIVLPRIRSSGNRFSGIVHYA